VEVVGVRVKLDAISIVIFWCGVRGINRLEGKAKMEAILQWIERK